MINEWRKVSPEHRAIIEPFLREVPVRLGAIAEALGITVLLSSLPSNISGQIKAHGNGYQIKINRNESRTRQRFTLAHEISHFLLHRDIVDDAPDGIQDNVLYRSGEPRNVEYEANRLAAELVMPTSMVENYLSQFDVAISDEAIEHLASRFGVSKAAMEIKMTA